MAASSLLPADLTSLSSTSDFIFSLCYLLPSFNFCDLPASSFSPLLFSLQADTYPSTSLTWIFSKFVFLTFYSYSEHPASPGSDPQGLKMEMSQNGQSLLENAHGLFGSPNPAGVIRYQHSTCPQVRIPHPLGWLVEPQTSLRGCLNGLGEVS